MTGCLQTYERCFASSAFQFYIERPSLSLVRIFSKHATNCEIGMFVHPHSTGCILSLVISAPKHQTWLTCVLVTR